LDGIRIPSPKTIIEKRPKHKSLRIALFGDSFTAGAEVPYTDTWGRRLEEKLRAQGAAVEVLNFGILESLVTAWIRRFSAGSC
jgi:lysophospholipase L1-like esterase